MSYQVIARKYRPQKFTDVVGQEHVTQTLANAIQQNRLAHAYLFCGPRGTGKTTLARIFAKCLRCQNAPTIEPCDNCSECKAIAAGNSMDMLEFDAASNTQVEKIRDIIIDHVRYAPSTGTSKLYLIDEVHMLSNSSFNALLKTLEEPPAHVKFLFATTDPEKLPATILSRCQRFDLRRIPSALITEQLSKIAAQEKVSVSNSALYAIARGADGGMRDAQSTLDQLISFCGNQVEETDVLSMFGLTGQAQLLQLTRAVLAGDIGGALRELNDLARNGKDLARLLSDLLNHFRNLLIYQVSRGDLKLLEVSEAEAATLKEQSANASADALSRIMEVLSDYEGRLRDATSKKILVEVALCKAIEARNAINLDTVLKKLNELRSQANPAGIIAAPAPTLVTAPAANAVSGFSRATAPAADTAFLSSKATVPEPPTIPAVSATSTPTSAPATPPANVKGDLDALWVSLLEAVGRVSNFTRTYLLEAHPVSLTKSVFTIGFDPEFADHISLIDNSKNHTLLATKMAELGHHGAQFKFIKAEAPANRVRPAAAAPAPTPAAPAAAPKSSPIVWSRIEKASCKER